MKDVWQKLARLGCLCSGPSEHQVRPFTHRKHEGSVGRSPGGRTPGKERMNCAESTTNTVTVAEFMVLTAFLYSVHQLVESLREGAYYVRGCDVSWAYSSSVLITGL